MAKSRFRIIALRPISPKYLDNDTLKAVRSIQKKVFGQKWLYFHEGYELSDVDNEELQSQTAYGYKLRVEENAYDDAVLYDQQDMCVNICAIVGENGSGKSSTVELMIRILNNLSVALRGEIKRNVVSEHLYFIENVYGSIVFEADGQYMQILIYGRFVQVGFYQFNERDNVYTRGELQELIPSGEQLNRFKPIEGAALSSIQQFQLFYTAIFNYSLYAFNYRDYYEERTLEDRWYTGKKGNVGEERLWKGKFQQDRVWLNGLFHKNDGYQTPIVLNPMREDGQIFVPAENKLAAERILSKLFYEDSSVVGRGSQPLFPLRYVNEHLEVVALRLSPIDNPKFSKQNLFSTLRILDNKLIDRFEQVRNDIVTTWSELMIMPYKEKTEHELLAWDYVVYKTLKIAKTYSQYGKIFTEVAYRDNYRSSKLHDYLEEMFHDESHITLKLRRALIFLKYRFFRENKEEIIYLYNVYSLYKKQLDVYEKFNVHLDVNTGHLLLDMPDEWTEEGSGGIFIEDGHLKIEIPKTDKNPFPLFFVNEDRTLAAKMPDKEEILPPPIFDIQLMLIEKENIANNGCFRDGDLIPLEGLSSGEKQIIFSVSNVAYHLCNINSVWDNSNIINYGQVGEVDVPIREKNPLIKYKYINVILDEVELYFHPDLQRRFVKNLMDVLKNIGIKHVEGINITIVTHSPFVLTDIPKSNILFMGKNSNGDIQETFGANIHELLNSNFFMEYSIGDLARTEIENLIRFYDKFCNISVKESLKKSFLENELHYQFVADHVGDNYLRSSLQQMMAEMRKVFSGQEIIAIDNDIKEAEEKLKFLKKKRDKKIRSPRQ